MEKKTPGHGRTFLISLTLIVLIGLLSAPEGMLPHFEIAWSWAAKVIGLAFGVRALWWMSGSIGGESTIRELLPGVVVLLGSTLLFQYNWGSSIALGLIGSAWLLGNRTTGSAD